MSPSVEVQRQFQGGMARIAEFWGFPRAVGAAYAAVYLSPTEVTLDDLVEAVGITKGALSAHMRMLERLGLVHLDHRAGDRKDYYSVDTDFWGVIRRVLQEREKREFGRALGTVQGCLDLIAKTQPAAADKHELAFYRERLLTMQRFFDGLDRIVGALLAVENFREATIGRLFGVKQTAGTRKRGGAA
jgi:DNA-binding transcriptional regulator GbsR (MarR family)